MELDSTTPPIEDVVDNDNNEVEVEEQEIVEEVEETTDASDYDKAWEAMDTSNPSDDLFGETNDDESRETDIDKPIESVDVDEPQVVTEGLMIKNPVLNYKGRDIPVDSEEEAINLMQKGFKLESEMSKIKPYKGIINVLDKSGIDIESLQTFADALGGNEGAKAMLASKLGLTASSGDTGSFFDEEVESKPTEEYKPDVPKQDQVADYFGSLTEDNPEVAGRVSQVYSDLEDDFKLEVYNPQVFPMFASSIASGEFDRLYPIAIKMRLGNPGLSWLQAYQMAGNKQGKTESNTVVPPKSTAVPKTTGSKRTTGDSYSRAWDMDTKDLEAKLFG